MTLLLKFHAIIIMISCFAIFSVVFTFDRKDAQLRAKGALFFTPFVASLLWQTLYGDVNFYHMLLFSSMGFFMAMLLWNLLSRKESGLSFSIFLSLLMPILIVYTIPLPITNKIMPYLPLSLLILMILNLILLRLFQKQNRKFFIGVLLSAVGLEIHQFGISGAEGMYLACNMAAYGAFMMYFFMDVRNQLFSEVEEALSLKREAEADINKVARRRVAEIELANKVLLDRSNTDGLSKSLNKRALIAKIKKMAEESSRERPFSLLMFDIDRFKEINDKQGHAVGDQCISLLSKIAKDTIREEDILGRYGGDEFIILLPNAHIDQAQAIAERFRKKVDLESKPHFTVSIGIACAPMDGKSYEALIEVADEGLYASKSKGRNAVSYRDSF